MHSQRSRCKQREKHEGLRHWFPLLPFQQFQVLFNSLFKVLCIFPSRYLFAIGLPPIFSFRWNLPPTWSCNPKQLDSSKARTTAQRNADMDGSVTLSAALFQGTSSASLADHASVDHNSAHRSLLPYVGFLVGCADSQYELIPPHSPLRGESWLVSFPPLINMLKFGGYSYLT